MSAIDAFFYAYQAAAAFVDFMLTIGPGCVFVGCLLAAWWACDRIRDAIAVCREAAAEHAQMARIRDAIEAAPLIPTQPGHDQQALDECNAIWDRSREEDTQP